MILPCIFVESVNFSKIIEGGGIKIDQEAAAEERILHQERNKSHTKFYFVLSVETPISGSNAVPEIETNGQSMINIVVKMQDIKPISVQSNICEKCFDDIISIADLLRAGLHGLKRPYDENDQMLKLMNFSVFPSSTKLDWQARFCFSQLFPSILRFHFC